MRRPHIFSMTCKVCGGGGFGDIQTSAAAWLPGVVVIHDNPAVCARILAAKQEALEQRELDLQKREAACV